jgi:hypothetical protein
MGHDDGCSVSLESWHNQCRWTRHIDDDIQMSMDVNGASLLRIVIFGGSR